MFQKYLASVYSQKLKSEQNKFVFIDFKSENYFEFRCFKAPILGLNGSFSNDWEPKGCWFMTLTYRQLKTSGCK